MSTLRIFNHYVRTPFVLLGTVETIILFISVYAAAHIRFWGVKIPYANLWLQALIYSAVMIMAMIAAGLFQARLREGGFGFVLRLLISYLLGTMGISVMFYLFPDLFFGRGVLIYTTSISFVTIALLRIMVLWLDPGIYRRRVLVLGTGKIAGALMELRRKVDQFGFSILGYIHLRGEHDLIPESKILKINNTLAHYANEHDVDEIVLAIDDRRKGIPMQELLDCKMHGVDIIDVVSFFERETGKIRIDQLQPSWLLFSLGFKQSVMRDIGKRIFDLLASGFILACTWPFMLVTILAIWLESGCQLGAPIFYRQVRVGINGRPFQVIKFRSMVVNAEKSGKAQWASKNDARITLVGKIIRKTRIDELPQIYNVFKGEMSFVGPRPERPEFVVMLAESIPYYSERHRVKPGITGWAQLLYPYGSTEKDALEKLQYDLYYVKNYSLFLDFLILLQTAEVVLFGRGAR
ncbi:MAG: TIGR03013 family PEP-CTERM/XrtA system glycosyltransferase [Gammaproteobacteria bacterium]|nr:TIGR03013 family PEP-CTERM/XrtA system glycosyltransferase [Gammaproteobacteria bacterium]